MRRTYLCTLFVSLFLCPCFLAFGQNGNKGEDTFTVVNVIQGDLIQVLGNGGKVLVRLAGIDAPVLWQPNPRDSQPFAKAARDYLASLVENKLVKIRAYGFKMGKYIVGEVLLGKKNINLEMVKEGYAEVSPVKKITGLNLSPFERAEARAREAKKGIWSLGDDYVSPRVWCRQRKAKSLCSIILYGILQQGLGKK